MKSKYIATFLSDEGGSSGFYLLKQSKTLGFKEFSSWSIANTAYKTQKKLAKFGLSPKVYGKVCKIKIECKSYNGQTSYVSSGWGFITQKAKVRKKLPLKKIQQLVDDIHKKTKLKFWDCHHYNIGTYRNKYLCIDTGPESFDINCNAWSNNNPGPICKNCNKCLCNCWSF